MNTGNREKQVIGWHTVKTKSAARRNYENVKHILNVLSQFIFTFIEHHYVAPLIRAFLG